MLFICNNQSTRQKIINAIKISAIKSILGHLFLTALLLPLDKEILNSVLICRCFTFFNEPNRDGN